MTNVESEIDGSGPINFIQEAMLKRCLKEEAGWKHLDPAQDMRAIDEWRHLTRECNISDLRNTHSSVSPTFRNGPHGPHRGQSVEDLTEKMVHGDPRPCDLPPLVAVRLERPSRELYVVCGNRRTRALQDLVRYIEWHLPGTPLPKVRVMIHDLPLNEIPDPSVRCAFLAKCVLAASTRNGGRHAHFRRHR